MCALFVMYVCVRVYFFFFHERRTNEFYKLFKLVINPNQFYLINITHTQTHTQTQLNSPKL